MNIQKLISTGHSTSHVNWHGRVQLNSEADMKRALQRDFPLFGKRPLLNGWIIKPDWKNLEIALLPRPNLVVNVGEARSLDNLFQINGTSPAPSPALGAVLRIGVDNGTTNPTATSLSSDAGGGADTGSSTQTLRTFNSAATRTGLVTTATGTFNDTTTAGIGAVGFAMKRLFLSAHTANITNTTAADSANTLYSMTNVFTIDFTSITTWSLTISATVTGVGA